MVEPDLFTKETSAQIVSKPKSRVQNASCDVLFYFLSSGLFTSRIAPDDPEVPQAAAAALFPESSSVLSQAARACGPRSAVTGASVRGAFPLAGSRLRREGRASLCHLAGHQPWLPQVFAPQKRHYHTSLPFSRKLL